MVDMLSFSPPLIYDKAFLHSKPSLIPFMLGRKIIPEISASFFRHSFFPFWPLLSTYGDFEIRFHILLEL